MTKTIKGTISITSLGAGYVFGEDIDEDVYIPSHLLNTALNGDEVEIIRHAKIEGEKLTGEVIKILSRKKLRFVGTIKVEKGGKFAFLTADDFRMYVSIFIPKISKDIKSNTKVLVEIISWTNPKKSPVGKILKVIGIRGDNDVEMESIVIEKGFDVEFPDDVKKDSKNIKNKSKESINNEVKSRKDFRDVLTFTIDGKDAKDFDDAISFKRLPDGLYEVGIHIADVSYWVKPNSPIDNEARKRGTSVYLVDRTIPMLPEVLSNDLCSLNFDEEKLTFSAVFTMSKIGEVKNVWFGRTITKSNCRYTYDLIQEIIDGKDDPNAEEIREIMGITQKLRKKRIENGALEFEHSEVNIEMDKKGKPIRIYLKEMTDSQRLIEELMVLANKEVALYLGGKNSKGLCIFRTSEKPDPDKINDAFLFLEKLGYNIEINKKHISSKDINNLLKKVKGTDEEFLIKTTIIRSLSRAIYSVINRGHFAMALEHYAHFTSPIRRYADLLVHRALEKKLKGEPETQEDRSFYKITAEKLSERQLDSSSAERTSIVFKQVEYMLERVGEVKNGIISKVTSWGIYVQEVETRTEGMVKLKDIKDDFYFFDEKTASMTGRRTKKKYLLGDRVKIKIIGGDVERKTIDYIFV